MSYQVRAQKSCTRVQQSARFASRYRVQTRAVKPAQHTQRTIVERDDGVETTHTLGNDGNWEQNVLHEGGGSKRAFGGIKDFFLPNGYPHEITPDYVPYQLWTLPTHITGWIGSSLVTSSLLKAAGLGTGAVGTVAAGATIKWIAKDGIGALGRYIVGGSLARYFDEDPRFWRFLADLIVTVGYALEIGTAASPGLFLLLAGGGNFAKVRSTLFTSSACITAASSETLPWAAEQCHKQAAGKGIGRPSFRVIQNHFALTSNVGDVAAKEEVWEVTAQLVGLALSVAALEMLQAQDGDAALLIVGSWTSVQTLHLVFRYKALQSLQLPWISQKRAGLLADAFVASQQLPTVEALCHTEPYVIPKALLPHATLVNASVSQLKDAADHMMLHTRLDAHPDYQQLSTAATPDADRTLSHASAGGHAQSSGAVAEAPTEPQAAQQITDPLSAALSLYEQDRYVLLPARLHGVERAGPFGFARELLDPRPRYVLGLKAGATDKDKLQAMLQVSAHERRVIQTLEKEHGGHALSGDGGDDDGHDLDVDAMLYALEYARSNVDAFQAAVAEQGWDVHDVIMWSSQKNVLQG